MLSLDSGGNYHGYIGDLARMAVLGEPDSELKDLLAEIEDVQQAAVRRDAAPALIGGEIYVAAEQALSTIAAPSGHRISRPRHGPGQPRGAAAHGNGPVPYGATMRAQPLEPAW